MSGSSSFAHAAAAADVTRRSRGRWKLLGLLAVCAAPVIASYLAYYVVQPQGRTNYAELVEPRDVPALPLVQLDGAPVAAQALRGQWLLVVVGPSSCDASCERRLLLQRQLREMTGSERDRVDKLWLVTDDGPIAPRLQAALDAAPPARVLRVPRAELARWLEPAPGRALDEHLYIVDPMGRWMMRAPIDPEPARLKRDLERLLRASASWDRAGR
jgi:hypothetical protein